MNKCIKKYSASDFCRCSIIHHEKLWVPHEDPCDLRRHTDTCRPNDFCLICLTLSLPPKWGNKSTCCIYRLRLPSSHARGSMTHLSLDDRGNSRKGLPHTVSTPSTRIPHFFALTVLGKATAEKGVVSRQNQRSREVLLWNVGRSGVTAFPYRVSGQVKMESELTEKIRYSYPTMHDRSIVIRLLRRKLFQ